MTCSIMGGSGSNNAATGLVYEEAVQHRLHAAELGGDVLTQGILIPQPLRFHALHDLLSLLDQGIQLGVGTDIELAEAIKEGEQVGNRRVAKYLPCTALIIAQPLTQMGDQLGKLAQKGLLG